MIAGQNMPEIESNQTLIGDIAQQTLQEMRLLVYQLRPSELRKLGLVGTLEQRLEVVERRAGIEARLGVEGEGALPYELEEQLYRIAQEALNNALKHAQATAVKVTIRFGDGKVSLTVEDDGRGFEPLALGEKGGLGLPNMSERAEKMGGRLTVQAAPGEGVTVHVEIPLEGNHENEAVQRGPGPAREEHSS
jgi:signal transduction histidine kinase